jgi:hypothetical protein
MKSTNPYNLHTNERTNNQPKMSSNMITMMSTVSSTPMDTMPSWMSISEGDGGADAPAQKASLKKKLGAAGSAFKGFFKDQAKVYRM